MEEIFFYTLLAVTISLLVVGFWKKKPVITLFAGIFFIILGVSCIIGVDMSKGHEDNTTFMYNATGHLVSETLTTTANHVVAEKDVTSFLTYSLFGLAIFFMSILEILSGGGVPKQVEEE